ncbi:MAG: HDOD domain-containing protein, partial [Candidatus Riflebacteria bacterium]
ASKDPQLVARMLKTANTTFLSRRFPVETLKAAVTYLGLEGIRQLLVHELFISFTQFFSNQRDKIAHLRRCSHLAAYIGKLIKADLPTIGKMRIAGLMHDIGSLAFSFYDKEEYAKVVNMVRKERLTTFDAETRVFGVSHQYLGGLYAREMGMPDYVVSVIERHHDQDIDPQDFVKLAVICANGFLNEKIEQINFSNYDQFFKLLADEIDAKNPVLQKAIKTAEKAGKITKSEDSDSTMTPSESESDEAASDEAQDLTEDQAQSFAEEIQALKFKPLQFDGLLKEEFDQYILSSANAQE